MASKKRVGNSAARSLAEYELKQAQGKAAQSRKKLDNRRALLVALGALILAAVLQVSYFGFGPGNTAEDANAKSKPSASAPAAKNSALVPNPAMAQSRVWSGSMDLSGKKLAFQLDGKSAPQAVANFISLSKKGFFTGLNCHRLTTAGIFVLQCGDPNGDGTGGPGYNWGPIENAPKDNLYKTGVLAMARVGNNASSMGSQFFIVYADSPIPADSVGGYSVFGRITNGLAAVTKIAKAGVVGGGQDGTPVLGAKLGAISLK
jgi:peptidyl-prolyl cis-trans isomerase B (cyclophilin B)